MTSLLHSYRCARRAIRVLQGQDLWQGIQQQSPTLSLGNQDASWCFCPDGLSEQSIVYSFGVGEEISFDLQLIERFGMLVYAFDPTPRSIQWVKSQALPEEFVFHAYGVAEFDGMCRFLPPADPAHVSHTLLHRVSPWPGVDLPVHRITTILKTLGHSAIDLLKMDIEGAEYVVLTDLIRSGVRPRQILVEFHHRWPEVGVEKTRRAIEELNGAGYRIFHVSASGEEYSFRYSLYG